MNPELEQHLLMVRDELEEMEDTPAREAAMNLLDALTTINKNYERAETVMSERRGLGRSMNYAEVQLPMSSALSEIVDAPQFCQQRLSGGRKYGPTPEPDDGCENWAVPGEEYCEDHL